MIEEQLSVEICQRLPKSVTLNYIILTVKENMTAYPVPKEEQWRIQILKEMILCRQFDTLSIDNFDTTEIGELLQIVCES